MEKYHAKSSSVLDLYAEGFSVLTQCQRHYTRKKCSFHSQPLRKLECHKQLDTASPCRIRAISKTIEETETAEQAAYRLVTNHTGLTMSRDFQVGE